MIIELEYNNLEERDKIVENNRDKYLIEERNTNDGNFLVFTTVKPTTVEVEELKKQNTELMIAVAELATANTQSTTETQLAIAELAALVTGGVK